MLSYFIIAMILGMVVGSALVSFIFYMERRQANLRRGIEEQRERQLQEGLDFIKKFERDLL